MMLAVTCSDVVGSIGNVVSVQAISENVVSLVFDMNFLPCKMRKERLVMYNQDARFRLCCSPKTVSLTTPVVFAMV